MEEFIMESYIPHKTPNKVFDNLKHIIKDKSFFEIGYGWGFTLNYLKNNFNIKKLGGVEYRKEQYNYCKEKFEYDVILGDALKTTIPTDYDIYYWWSTFTLNQHIELIEKNNKGIIIISFWISSPVCHTCNNKKSNDTPCCRCCISTCKGCGVEIKGINICKELQKKYNCQLIETYYNEKDEYSIHKCRTSGLFRSLIINFKDKL